MKILISECNTQEEFEPCGVYGTTIIRGKNEKENYVYDKVKEFVENIGIDNLAGEEMINAELKCLVILENGDEYIELSDVNYNTKYVRVMWNDYISEFELYQK